jgi:hypothetical protein
MQLPSRRVLVAAGVLVLAVLVVVYWHAIVSVTLAGLGLAFVHRLWRRSRPLRRRAGRGLPHWLEALALVSGARSARRLTLAHSGELHAARLETERARAAELRSRVEHRRRTREEQEAAERRAYIRGAADAEGFTRS